MSYSVFGEQKSAGAYSVALLSIAEGDQVIYHRNIPAPRSPNYHVHQ